VWSDIKDGDFLCLAEFVEETTISFIDMVRKCHAKIFDAADRRFEGRRIVTDGFQEEGTTTSESLSTFHQTAHARTGDSPVLLTTDISGQYVPPTPPGYSNNNR
jgi:hypothetical protein